MMENQLGQLFQELRGRYAWILNKKLDQNKTPKYTQDDAVHNYICLYKDKTTQPVIANDQIVHSLDIMANGTKHKMI